MNTTNLKTERAKARIKKLKGFYVHFTVYILVNIFLSSVIISEKMYSGAGFFEAFWNFESFSTALFWGIGLLFHAIRVFSLNPFFSKEWEDRQIKKYMEKDTAEIEKFK